MITKTPDEIKEQLLKECRYKYGTLGNWFEECMDKAFSLGVEEGKKQNKDISLCKDCHCMTNTLTICGKCKSFKLQEEQQ